MQVARRRLAMAVAASVLVVLAYLVVTWARSGDEVSLRDLVLEDLDGRPVLGRDLLGAHALVNVWATWCAPCRAEQPTLLALARERRVPIPDNTALRVTAVGTASGEFGTALEWQQIIEKVYDDALNTLRVVEVS